VNSIGDGILVDRRAETLEQKKKIKKKKKKKMMMMMMNT
jgi:hypothetical protein